MGISAHARAAAYLWLPVLLINSQSRATVLVEYTFGDSVATATNLPQSVAANLSATPMIGKHDTGQVVPHSFIEWSPGNMAMRLTSSDGPAGGRKFQFTLEADPGFTFQVNDFVVTFRAVNTYGNNRSIAVRPNLDPGVSFVDVSGGDFMATFGPAYPFWNMANWNAFVLRTDLTSLVVEVAVMASGGPFITDLEGVRISGDVLPDPCVAPSISAQPEPAATCGRTPATFTVVADGSPPYSYQWRKDGQPLSDGPSGTGSTIQGSTTDTLTVLDATEADEGAYDCEVTGACGDLTSSPATLTVCSANLNGDLVVDLADYQQFYSCRTGPGGTAAGGCECADADADGDVDLLDFLGFQAGFACN